MWKAKPPTIYLFGTYSARSLSHPKTYRILKRGYEKPKRTQKTPYIIQHLTSKHCTGTIMKESHLYQGCGPQDDSTSSPQAADALCTAGVDHGKLHELCSVKKRWQDEQRDPKALLLRWLWFSSVEAKADLLFFSLPFMRRAEGPPKRPITMVIRFLRDPSVREQHTFPLTAHVYAA